MIEQIAAPSAGAMGTDGASATDSAFVSPEEFSRLTHLSLATVRRRLKDRSIPFLQPGGHRCRVLIPRDALRLDWWSTIGRGSDDAEPRDGDDESPPIQPSPEPRLSGPAPRWRKPR